MLVVSPAASAAAGLASGVPRLRREQAFRLLVGESFDLADERALDRRGKLRHGRAVEQRAQREVDAEGLAQPGVELDAEQRVAAEVEEVVVDAHLLEPEQLLPDLDQQLLGFAARRLVGRRQAGPGVALRRAAAAVAAGASRCRVTCP